MSQPASTFFNKVRRDFRELSTEEQRMFIRQATLELPPAPEGLLRLADQIDRMDESDLVPLPIREVSHTHYIVTKPDLSKIGAFGLAMLLLGLMAGNLWANAQASRREYLRDRGLMPQIERQQIGL
jgi:hypothetical protein